MWWEKRTVDQSRAQKDLRCAPKPVSNLSIVFHSDSINFFNFWTYQNFQNLLNIKFTLVLVLKVSPQDLNNRTNVASLQNLGRKPKKVFFWIFWSFWNGEQKIEDWKKHGEGGVTKIVHQNPWKTFLPSATSTLWGPATPNAPQRKSEFGSRFKQSSKLIGLNYVVKVCTNTIVRSLQVNPFKSFFVINSTWCHFGHLLGKNGCNFFTGC